MKYPLRDDYRIERVSQFHKLIADDLRTPKKNYLSFLKRVLLDLAYGNAEESGDLEETVSLPKKTAEDAENAKIYQRKICGNSCNSCLFSEDSTVFVENLAKEPDLSFADVVTELDYPRFPEGKTPFVFWRACR